jgi:glycerol-3-phosphate acyltransferase PlsY
VWLKFKGGKGVASTLGMLLVTYPFVGVFTCATWLVTAGLFRYSSLAALIALTAAPIYALFLELPPEYPCFYGFLAVLALIRHQSNIRRLIKGEESKIGKKKTPAVPATENTDKNAEKDTGTGE